MPTSLALTILVFGVLYLAIFSIVVRSGFSYRGWARAWLFLGLLAAISRVALLSPFAKVGPALSLIAQLVLCGVLIFKAKKQIGLLSWSPQRVVMCLFAGFIFFRHLFPQFDVDSLSYHLAAIEWHYLRAELPALAKQVSSPDFRFSFIGFEEFLCVPGLVFDLPFYAGQMSGLFKVVGCLTVASLIPASVYIFRYVLLFLFLIDDHYFFSGLSRFINLTPSLIALIPLLTWYAVRVGRGKFSDFGDLLGLCFLIATTKYFGGFFAALACGLVAILLLLRGDGLKFIGKLPQGRYSWALGSILFFLILYGVNIIETGTPVHPFKAAFFKPKFEYYGPSFFYIAQPSLTELIREHHYRLITFSGNMSLKLVVIALPFVALLFAVRFKRLLKCRYLLFGIIGVLMSVGWVLIAHKLSHQEARFEGRYPRYIFGLAAISSLYLGLEAFAFLRKRMNFSKLSNLQWIGGLLIFFYIAATIDTRYFNIGPYERPSYKDIVDYLKNPVSLYESFPIKRWAALFMFRAHIWADPIEKCLEREGFKKNSRGVMPGGEIAAFTREQNWPSAFFLPGMVRLDLYSAVSVQSFTEEQV